MPCARKSKELGQGAREHLHPHTYSHIDVSAIAKDHVGIGSAEQILTVVVDLDADQHLATKKDGSVLIPLLPYSHCYAAGTAVIVV